MSEIISTSRRDKSDFPNNENFPDPRRPQTHPEEEPSKQRGDTEISESTDSAKGHVNYNIFQCPEDETP